MYSRGAVLPGWTRQPITSCPDPGCRRSHLLLHRQLPKTPVLRKPDRLLRWAAPRAGATPLSIRGSPEPSLRLQALAREAATLRAAVAVRVSCKAFASLRTPQITLF